MNEGRLGAWWFWAAAAGASVLGAFATVAILGSGCNGATAASPAPGGTAVVPAPGSAAALPAPGAAADLRDQYAFLAELEEAGRGRDEERDAALDRVREGWLGRRYVWEARVVPALCTRADRCFVVPFDHARREAPIVQGWLPRLGLDDAAFAALRDGCAGRAACVVRFGGTLSELTVSTALPTALSFSDVTIAATRDAGPTEAWLGRAAAPTVAGAKPPSPTR